MKETRYDIHLPIKKKIALVADIHNATNADLLPSLRRNHPDLILIPGDMVEGYQFKMEGSLLLSETNSIEILRACPDIAPTFFSLGNHEALIPEGDLRLLESFHINVLDDAVIPFEGMWIAGVTSNRVISHRKYDEIYKGKEEYAYSHYLKIREQMYQLAGRSFDFLDALEEKDGYKIVLCHHPEYYFLKEPYLGHRKIDLVVSGHAHGGQMRFYDPFHKRWQGILSPNQGLFPKYTYGVHSGEYGKMVITTGLANTEKPIPRLFNETEVVYIT